MIIVNTLVIVILVCQTPNCRTFQAVQAEGQLNKLDRRDASNVNLPLSKRGIPAKIFGKVRETFEEVKKLEGLFRRHLNLLDRFLTAGFLPQGAGSVPLISLPKFSMLPDLSVLRQLFHSGTQNIRSTAVCHACRVGAGLFMFKARTGFAIKELQSLAILACKLFKISSPEVCTGMVQIYVPILEFIVNERQEVTPDRFCGVALQSFGCISKDWKDFEWNIDLGKELNHDFSTVEPEIPPGIDTVKILHLADIHVDPHYIVGSQADCENELCCRDEMSAEDKLVKPEQAAGYFGDLRKCDVPYHSLKDGLEQISYQHPDTELIYMTGDLVPHDVWSTDPNTNVEIIANISNLLRTYFPKAQVIPVIGNHESHPVNLFAPTDSKVRQEFSPRWLYAAALESWHDWIPKSDHDTFLKSAYYSIKIRPNFRVVVLNTNLCYGFNFWQLYSYHDPGDQLAWLYQTLKKAEQKQENVHIVSHVPAGMDECVSTWSRNFYKIIKRFRGVVRAQFYAHTHFDEMQLYYHATAERATPMTPVFLGPSLSPFINLNPGYKVYFADGTRGSDSSWHVVDFETWIYNLTEANLEPSRSPDWYQLYRATEAYGLPDVLPSSIDILIQRMSSNETLFDLYYKFYMKATEASLSQPCDKICRKKILCNMVTSYYEGQTECVQLESGVDGVILPKRLFEKFRTIVIRPLDKLLLNPIHQGIVKPLEKIGRKFTNLFKG